jgi:hypothetical protein
VLVAPVVEALQRHWDVAVGAKGTVRSCTTKKANCE